MDGGRRGLTAFCTAHDRLRRRALRLVPLLALALLSACAVQKAAQGVAGTDLTVIRAGAARSDIEALLGQPERQWATPAGITYRVYRYDVGVPGGAMNAMPLVFGEIATLGLLEVIVKAVPPEPAVVDPRRWRRVAVAYDADGVVVGVFIDVDDFAVLPDDGRPRKPAISAPP